MDINSKFFFPTDLGGVEDEYMETYTQNYFFEKFLYGYNFNSLYLVTFIIKMGFINFI